MPQVPSRGVLAPGALPGGGISRFGTWNIADPRNPTWRRRLQMASFKGAPFYVDQQGRSSGRRTVIHQYPKRDIPYAEDMGRKAYGYQVRGYCIAYPHDTKYELWRRDYRIARDILRNALEQGGPGRLQLPSLPPVIVALGGPEAVHQACEAIRDVGRWWP